MFGRTYGCQPCRLAKRLLDDSGVKYVYHDIETDDTAADAIRALGYTSVPVFIVNGESFPFDPTRIKSAITMLAAA